MKQLRNFTHFSLMKNGIAIYRWDMSGGQQQIRYADLPKRADGTYDWQFTKASYNTIETYGEDKAGNTVVVLNDGRQISFPKQANMLKQLDQLQDNEDQTKFFAPTQIHNAVAEVE
jgi:hypothetical protein